jgi:hypothetical protein
MINQKAIDKAVDEFDKKVPLGKLTTDYIFEAGVKFVQDKFNKLFPNGFDNWQETHYEIVSEISFRVHGSMINNKLDAILETQGRVGLYDLAKELTNKFENLYKGEDWIELDYFEAIDEFLRKELYD